MKNWAGNLTYRASQILEPTSVSELQEIVARSPAVRALGSRHSFNDLADSDGVLVSLARLPREIIVDRDSMSFTIDGGTRYGDVCVAVDASGLALHNMASLPHISVAGAIATGTHGSGNDSANLSTAVRHLEIVGADGEIVALEREVDADFPGAVVALGALGIVTRLTLDAEPAYRMRQDVFEELPFGEFGRRFDEITAMAHAVSFFTDWRRPLIDQVWLKRRLIDDGAAAEPLELGAARPATEQLHPIQGMDASACTTQLGVPGAWYDRLPHFRMDHTPSSGDELQTEYFVGRENLVAAIQALEPLRSAIAAAVQVTEIRTVAADDLWLSPAHERASATIHFTWLPDRAAVDALLPKIEAALAPFVPRPHWAKLFSMSGDRIRAAYPRIDQFLALARRLDPEGKFQNDFLRRLLFSQP